MDGITIDRFCTMSPCPATPMAWGGVGRHILYVISLWGDTRTDFPADLSGDGEIGVDDLLLIIANW